MSIKLKVTVDQTQPGSEEFLQLLLDELRALNYGDIEVISEKPKDGSLSALATVGIIVGIVAGLVSISNNLPGGIKNIKNLFEDVRARFVFIKQIEPKTAPKYLLEVLNDKIEIAKCEFPSTKGEEEHFFEEIKKLEGKNDSKSNSSN